MASVAKISVCVQHKKTGKQPVSLFTIHSSLIKIKPHLHTRDFNHIAIIERVRLFADFGVVDFGVGVGGAGIDNDEEVAFGPAGNGGDLYAGFAEGG